jgi:signal transduction histidine kinase
MTASNSDDLWSKEGLSIEITIGQPMWQTLPFLAIVVILVSAIGLALYRLRIMSMEARSQELEVEVENRTAELKSEVDQRIKAEEALRESEREKAVAEERSRLARDLHDAVTQTLFSATLISEAVPELWEQDPEEGRALLKEVQQLSRGALAEMRTLLMELRPETLTEASLPDLMKQLAESVVGRLGVPVSVRVEGECSVPPDVHVTLYRITQEALNNVIKHSQATEVEIQLLCSVLSTAEREPAYGNRVELSVRDNGRGFAIDSAPTDRLGLEILRERAEAIGAKIKIESEIGEGTEVKVEWEGG